MQTASCSMLVMMMTMLVVVVEGNSHHIDPKWFVGVDDHSQDESCFRSISEDSSTAVEALQWGLSLSTDPSTERNHSLYVLY